MQTRLDCLPCFYKQALNAARLSGADLETQREVLNQFSQLVPDLSLEVSPAEIGRTIYGIVTKMTGKKDPYRDIKDEVNKIALKIYPAMKMRVLQAENQLQTALQLAIIGNLIDFGVKDFKKITVNIDRMIEHNFYLDDNNFKDNFEFQSFCQKLSEVQSILYLADSAGEVVFDLILIEQLVNHYHKNVIYTVKGKPVLIDALVDDAIYCGINRIANVTSCGADCPGVVLEYCTPEFIRLFNEAEMIISKGQGNYGALSDESHPLFFLLNAKCPIIAEHIGCHTGDFVLKNGFIKDQEPLNDNNGVEEKDQIGNGS